MNTPKYIIVLLMVIGLAACKQKNKTAAENKPLIDSAIVDLREEKPVPTEQLIIPGISIGQTSLNENGDNVYKRLGTPDAGDAAMGKSVSIWYANHDTTGFITQIYFSRNMGDDEINRVKYIRVTSPWFKVSNSIHTGVSFKQVLLLYKLKKVATFNSNGLAQNIYDDVNAGIAFEVDGKDTVRGITVHEPKTDVTTSYLAFFPDIKLLK